MITNVIFVLSVILFVVTLLEIFLDEKQKQALQRSAMVTWSWLDDTKRLSPFVLMRAHLQALLLNGFSVFLALLAIGYAALVWTTGGSIRAGLFDALLRLMLLVGFLIINALMFSWLIVWMMETTKWWATLVLAAIVSFLWWAWAFALPGLLFGDGPVSPGVLIGDNPTWLIESRAYRAFLWFGSLAIGAPVAFSVIPIIFAFASASLLCIVEFLMRRIAEYPKGPILAASAICGALAALFKAFGK
jgi:hypothetical protein